VILNDNFLIFLQQKLRMYRFIMNFKKYREYVSNLKGTSFGKKIGLLENDEYLIELFLLHELGGSKQFLILAWHLLTFRKFE